MDNVCKWVQSDVKVSLCWVGEWELEICIEDNGLGLIDEQVKVVFKWGVCLDEKVLGFGFGLFIVIDLVRVYEGEVEFFCLEMGGFLVSVKFLVIF